jgi:hypothetical protein
LGEGRQEERTQEHEETSRVIDMFTKWWGGFHRSEHMELYTSNTCSLLYVNYASIKLFKKRKMGRGEEVGI